MTRDDRARLRDLCDLVIVEAPNGDAMTLAYGVRGMLDEHDAVVRELVRALAIIVEGGGEHAPAALLRLDALVPDRGVRCAE